MTPAFPVPNQELQDGERHSELRPAAGGGLLQQRAGDLARVPEGIRSRGGRDAGQGLLLPRLARRRARPVLRTSGKTGSDRFFKSHLLHFD